MHEDMFDKRALTPGVDEELATPADQPLGKTPSPTSGQPVPTAQPTRRGRFPCWLLVVPGGMLVLALMAGRKGHTMQFRPPKKAMAKTPADYGLSYQDVSFPSRQDHLVLRGWFIPGVLADGQLTTTRTILVVHGLDSSRAAPEAGLLDLSAKLARQGFAILAFDTRGHGESVPARPSMGYFEQYDVLGAVDFLCSGPLPFPGLGRPRAIGGYGLSMGGAALLLAAAREPAIQAVITDCTFAAFVPLIAHATRMPSVFIPAIVKVMGLLFGINYQAIRPLDVVAGIAPRPLFFIHSDADTIVPPEHLKLLAAAASAGADARVQTWLIAGAQHIQSYHTMGTEYVSRVVSFFTAALGPAAPAVEATDG